MHALIAPRGSEGLPHAQITCAASLVGWSLLSRVRTQARAMTAASAASQATIITLVENVPGLQKPRSSGTEREGEERSG